MLKLEGIEAFNKGIDTWLVDVEQLAVETLRGLSVQLFDAVIKNTPQFTGNAVANWKYSVDGKDASHDDFFKELFYNEQSDAFPLEIEAFSKSRVNEFAMQYAKDLAAGKELGVTDLSNVIYISNSVEYNEWLSTATEANLREVNHVGHLISHSILDVVEGQLFITTSKANQLARERI